MRVQVASDLHLELLHRQFPGERLISSAHEADILVLAGDISYGAQAIELFKDWPVPVLYLAGNHELLTSTFSSAGPTSSAQMDRNVSYPLY